MQVSSQQYNTERNEQKSDPSCPNTLPVIVNNNSSLHKLTSKSLDALKAANNPPRLFQQRGRLVRIRQYEEVLEIEPVTIDIMRGHVDRAAAHRRKYKVNKQKSASFTEFPLLDTTRDVLSLDSYPEDVFPPLAGVVVHPYYTQSGQLVTTPGYNPESKQFYHPAPGFVLPPIPEKPTRAQVQEASLFLGDELLGDFPFSSNADLANAIAFVCQPFIRNLILGPTPLGLIEAPVPGTGKGLLANCIAIASTGYPLEVSPQRGSEEEWRKFITAVLINTPPYVFLDNLNGRVNSSSLAAALTTDRWTDRFLGETRMVRLPIRCCWLATANNLELGPDIARRTVPIRLDARMEAPESRDVAKFKHPRKLQWAQAQRPRIVQSVLMLTNAWIAGGQPPGSATMGSYESWAGVLSGIISHRAFLSNREDIRVSTDDDLAEFGQFIAAWVNEFPAGLKQRVDDLFSLLEKRKHLLPYVMSSETEQGQRARFGRWLNKKRDRVYKCLQLKVLPQVDKSRRRYYTLIDVTPTPNAAPGDQPPAMTEWPASFFEVEIEDNESNPEPEENLPKTLDEIHDA